MLNARRVGILLVALSLLACDDTTSPGIEPEISNDPDNFEFQVTALSNYSRTLTYEWSNSGVGASVDHSSAITGGSATLLLEDDDGTQVYAGDLADDGTFISDDGVAGNWRIRVVFEDTDGTINFRVQKRP